MRSGRRARRTKQEELTEDELKREPMPRESYIDYMKSLARLKQLQINAKDNPVEERSTVVLFEIYCHDCREFIDMRPVRKRALCDRCAEQHRLLSAQAHQRAKEGRSPRGQKRRYRTAKRRAK